MLFQSATALVHELSLRKVSARELLDLYVAQVAKHNGTINAVVALDVENARKTASAIDDRRGRGESLGPLAGLPMTIKDLFEVVGMPTTCGIPDLAGHMPSTDAVAVARLKAAGAVVFGKTNLPTGASDWQSYNPIYGLTRNPWNTERTVGGSSGGSAASMAAGFSGLELGSDIAGSIRVPSHFCGVFGLKPTHGIVPGRGHIPGGLGETPLGVMGPIGRSAADLRLALAILAGADEGAARGWKLSLPPARHDRLKDFRVGVWMGEGSYPVDGAYRAALESFISDLAKSGAHVSPAKPPFEPAEAYELYLSALFGVVGAGAPTEANAFEAHVVKDDTGYAKRLACYMRASLGEWFGINEQRERLFRAWRDFFERFDVLLCPAFTVVAFPHMIEGTAHSDQLTRRLSVNGNQAPYFDGFMWPSMATNAHLPAVSMPTARLVGGMPAGIQIIAPEFEDLTAIRFAELAEREFGGFKVPPAVTA